MEEIVDRVTDRVEAAQVVRASLGTAAGDVSWMEPFGCAYTTAIYGCTSIRRFTDLARGLATLEPSGPFRSMLIVAAYARCMPAWPCMNPTRHRSSPC